MLQYLKLDLFWALIQLNGKFNQFTSIVCLLTVYLVDDTLYNEYMEDLLDRIRNEKKLTRHYYGDLVRILFMTAAIIMIVTLPFLTPDLPIPFLISIFAILIIGILAGITNPLQKWTTITDTIISTIGLLVFEYFAVTTYIEKSYTNLFFITNQILAVIFLFALYYTTKTLRAMVLKSKNT